MATKIKPITDDDNGQTPTVITVTVLSARNVLRYASHCCTSIYMEAWDANSFKCECSSLKELAQVINGMIRATNLIIDAIGLDSIYQRPIRQIATEVKNRLLDAVFLVRKSKPCSLLRRLIPVVSTADFINLQTQLKNCVVDMTWLHDLFGAGGGGISLTFTSIACKDPIISWVWTFVASLYMGQMSDKIEAANGLASLAIDNDRNKEYIVEEGGVAPLLKLLKDNSCVDVQIAAATVLLHIANNVGRICVIRKEVGVPIIVQALGDSAMEVQIKLADLVARMADHSELAQADFGRANAIEQFVTLLLSIDSSIDELHMPVLASSSLSMQSSNDTLMKQLSLKTSCAEALRMLARGSVSNSRRILETKGLLCLARILEKEQEGALLFNSLMTITEVTVAAESNDLSRAAYTNSVAVNAVFDQLLRVIKEHDDDDLELQIPAIRAVGYLSRTYPARVTTVTAPLVEQLSHINEDVAAEAAIALCKFVSPDNFQHLEHSKSIVGFKGVLLSLLRLLKKGNNERGQFHGFVLICYLALHAGNNETLEPWVLTTLVEADSMVLFAQYPKLIDLRTAAIEKLSIKNNGVLHQWPTLSCMQICSA